jgi:hypothetical protein
VGLAGGLAMKSGRKKGPLSRLSGSGLKPKVKAPKLKGPKTPSIKAPNMKKPDEALKALGKAAGEVAQRSQRVGEVASEVQNASDAIGGSAKKH